MINLTILEKVDKTRYKAVCPFCGKEFLNRLSKLKNNRHVCDLRTSEEKAYEKSLKAKYRHLFFRHKKRFPDTEPISYMAYRALINRPCVYCGSPHVGVDRVNSQKGYEESNCQPCCSVCNNAKHTLSESEFLIWLYKSYTFSQERINALRNSVYPAV